MPIQSSGADVIVSSFMVRLVYQKVELMMLFKSWLLVGKITIFLVLKND